SYPAHSHLSSFPTRRSSDLSNVIRRYRAWSTCFITTGDRHAASPLEASGRKQSKLVSNNSAYRFERNNTGTSKIILSASVISPRSEEHTSELQSRVDLVCRL